MNFPRLLGALSAIAFSLPMVTQPVLSKRAQAWQRLAVLLPIGRRFARDDVINVANGKTLDFYPSAPRILESLDPVWSKYQINIKWPVLKLDEILASLNLSGLVVSESKSQLSQRLDKRSPVLK